MVNYAETVSISTVVPVMPLSPSQCQEQATDSLISILSALLEHPEFQQGVRACQEFYFDSYEEAPLSEEEMHNEVEINLSRRTVQSDQQFAAAIGKKPPSYLHKLGCTIGTIAKGLSYAQG